MAEFSIVAESVIEPPWLDAKSIAVGRIPQARGTPELFLLIEKNGAPFLRVDVYADGEDVICFEEFIIWNSWAVIGYGSRVHLVSLAGDQVKSLELDDYFGHFYASGDFLLAASGSSLYKIDENAEVIWKSADLGIDGVLVREISGDVIFGEGEWDPPGGWKPFQISCLTGSG